MKLTRKSIGRIAASFVATAMLATMAIVPASAANTGVTVPGKGETTVSSITVNKILEKRAYVHTPTVTFDINVAPVNETDINGETVDDIPVQPGVTAAIQSVGDFVFTASEDDKYLAATEVPATATISFDATKFSAPGIYKYVVSEGTTNVEGITNDAPAYLYLYVEEDGDSYKITNVVMTREDTTTGKTDRFTNVYGGDEDNQTVNDLILTKDVTGNQGDTKKEFSFTIKMPSNTSEYYAVYSGSFVEGEWVNDELLGTITPDNSSEGLGVPLADGEYVRVYGLSSSDNYTIVENDANEGGYDTTIASTSTATIDNDEGTVSGTIQADTTITYTNNRESSTPTGIMMDIAPYAVLVVIAAAGCFIFLRKRHAKED